jgi:hypothetical protein
MDFRLRRQRGILACDGWQVVCGPLKGVPAEPAAVEIVRVDLFAFDPQGAWIAAKDNIEVCTVFNV